MFGSRRFLTLGAAAVSLLTLASGHLSAQSRQGKADAAKANHAQTGPVRYVQEKGPARYVQEKGNTPYARAGDAFDQPFMPPEGLLGDAGLYVTINPSRLADSPFRDQITKYIVMTGLLDAFSSGVEAAGGVDEFLEKMVVPVLGFDPLKDIDSIQVVVPVMTSTQTDDSDDSSKDQPFLRESVAVVTFHGDVGNLEGIVMLAPSYESEENEQATIHSGINPFFGDDGGPFAMGIIKPQGAGRVCAVFGQEVDRVKAVVDELSVPLEGRPPVPVETTPTGPNDGSVLVSAGARIDGGLLDNYRSDNGAVSATINRFSRVDVRVKSADDQLFLDVAISVRDEKRSEQARQLIQALLALQLASLKHAIQTDQAGIPEEFVTVTDVLSECQISRDGALVRIQLQMSPDTFITCLGLLNLM